MIVVEPVAIDDANLISSTAPEPGAGEAAFNAATNYTIGSEAILTAVHRVFSNLLAGVNAALPNVVPQPVPARWLDVRPTNKWAMFDGAINTATQLAAGPLTVTVAAGYVNTLSLQGPIGSQVEVTVRKGLAGPVIYSYTKSLIIRRAYNWWEWLFSPHVQARSLTLTNLPMRSNAHITVSITGTGAVGCGLMYIGRAHYLGASEFGLGADIDNTTRLTEDDFANVTLRRGFSRRNLQASFWVPHEQVPRVESIMESVMGKPALYIGAAGDKYRSWTTVFGVCIALRRSLSHETETLCTIEVKGFI